MGYVFTGNSIRQLREGLELSIEAMAKLCGISRMTLYV